MATNQAFITPLLQTLQSTSQVVTTEFGKLSAEQLNWKANPQKWSIAQCLDHLMVVDSSYFPVFEQIAANTYQPNWLAKLGFGANWVGSYLLRTVSPQNKMTMQVPTAAWLPASSSLPADVVEQFAHHQQVLADKFTRVTAHLGVVMASPASPFIIYTVRDALAIIVAHQQRHLQQAQNVKKLAGFAV